MSTLNLFIPLSKVDEEKRLVYGLATAEIPDRANEICDYETTKPHYEAWSGTIAKASDGKSMGNLRVMHGKVAAGKIIDIGYNDEKKQITVCAKVVDDNEWRKVQEGVYTGFSQGGSYLKRWDDPNNPGMKRYTAKPTEISLVDVPCLGAATFEYVKADGVTEMRKFQEVEKYSDSEERDEKGRWTGTGKSALLGAASGAIIGGVVGGTVAPGKGGKIGAAVGAALVGATAVKNTYDANNPDAPVNQMIAMHNNIDKLESKGFKFEEDFKRFDYKGKTYKTHSDEGRALIAQHVKYAKIADDDVLDTAESAEDLLKGFTESEERDALGRWTASSTSPENHKKLAAFHQKVGRRMESSDDKDENKTAQLHFNAADAHREAAKLQTDKDSAIAFDASYKANAASRASDGDHGAGALAGALAGAVIGSVTGAGAVPGAVAGGILGHLTRKSDDPSDLAKISDDDVLDAAEMLSVLKTGSPVSWVDFVGDAHDALRKYSDKQERDEKGRWAAIGGAVLSGAAGGAIGGAITGRKTGAVVGAIGGAINSAVAVRRDKSSVDDKMGHFTGGATLGLVGGIGAAAVDIATRGPTAHVKDFAQQYKGSSSGSARTSLSTVQEMMRSDIAVGSASDKQLKAADEVFQNWYKNRYKKMEGGDLDLQKQVWGELLDLRSTVLFVETVADMAKSLDSGLQHDAAVELVLDSMEKYSDSEPRDKSGKWTDGGSSGGSKKDDNGESAALRAIRGAVTGAKSAALGSLPSAAIATVLGGPAAGLATVIADASTGAIAGSAAGAFSDSKNVESNAATAAMVAGVAQGAVAGYRGLRSLFSSPQARATAYQGAKTAVGVIPKVVGAVKTGAKAVVHANDAIGRVSQAAADRIVSATRRVAGYGKIDQIPEYLIELEKMGVDVSYLVSALREEEEMVEVTNQEVQKMAEAMAEAAGGSHHWSSYIGAARETLEKSASTSGSPPTSGDPSTLQKSGDSAHGIHDVVQKWIAQDGSAHDRKEDALAKNDELRQIQNTEPARKILDEIRSVVVGDQQVTDRFSGLRKYMGEEVWDTQRATEALTTVFSLLQKEIAESESDPEQVASLQAAVTGLKQFIASEIQEDNSVSAEKLAGALNDLAKAGRRNSAEDQEHIQKAHDHTMHLGARCSHDNLGDDAEKAAMAESLQKVTTERNDLVKSLGEITAGLASIRDLVRTQAERIATLEAQPIPAPNLRAVSKGADAPVVADGAQGDLAKMIAGLSPQDRAEVMIRASQQHPQQTLR